MRIIDISTPLRAGMVVYEGDPEFQMLPCARLVEGDPDSFATSRIEMGSHTGTHIDPPCHFIPGGASVADLDLSSLCGSARVLDLRDAGPRIDADVLARYDLEGVARLLLRTSNEGLAGRPFERHYAHLTESGADYLRGVIGVGLVGIDHLSIEAYESPGFPVHKKLLGGESPVIVVEGLALAGVEAGDYELWCLPLKLVGGDGGPARAALVARR